MQWEAVGGYGYDRERYRQKHDSRDDQSPAEIIHQCFITNKHFYQEITIDSDGCQHEKRRVAKGIGDALSDLLIQAVRS